MSKPPSFVAQVFQFDRDVAPLVDLVVEHTLEQALMEVRQEEEQRHYGKAR
jgi:hypothetical protein